jgi:hypothetical protein
MPVQNAIDPAVALAAVEGMNAKIDAITEKLARTPEDQLTIRTIPAVTVGRGPDGEIAAPTDAAAPNSEITAEPIRPIRTDAEIFDLVARFLDPAQLGPLFVSTPIRRRVFIGVYPTFVEILSSERVLGVAPTNISPEVNNMWIAAGELGIAIKGFLWVNDPGLELIVTNAGTPAKWPALNRFSVANNRDPHIGEDIADIWKQYQVWKREVTPSEDELKKYSEMNG